MSSRILLIGWPTDESQQFLWAALSALWIVGAYYTWSDPIQKSTDNHASAEVERQHLRIATRALAIALLTLVSLGRGTSNAWTAVALGGMSLTLSTVRNVLHARASRAQATWEIVVNAITIGGLGILIAAVQLTPGVAWVAVPVTPKRLCAVYGTIVGIALMGRPATYIVRGLLANLGALPQVDTPSTEVGEVTSETTTRSSNSLDANEYNRGRVIGNFERTVLLTFVVMGRYEAIAFVIAAKGLIRSKEFEDRNFAEYFLIGTFASVAIALVVGLLLRALLGTFW